MVEVIETKLGNDPEEKIFLVAEGYDNQVVSEEYRYTPQPKRLLGIRFFNKTNTAYPRDAVDVFASALEVFYTVTPFVLLVNPITSFKQCVADQKNGDFLLSLFTLFLHRLCFPSLYLLNPTNAEDIGKLLEKITYPEPPVNMLFTHTPVMEAVKHIKRWAGGGNFLDAEHV